MTTNISAGILDALSALSGNICTVPYRQCENSAACATIVCLTAVPHVYWDHTRAWDYVSNVQLQVRNLHPTDLCLPDFQGFRIIIFQFKCSNVKNGNISTVQCMLPILSRHLGSMSCSNAVALDHRCYVISDGCGDDGFRLRCITRYSIWMQSS